METNVLKENSLLKLAITGRIDSQTAPILENELSNLEGIDKVILDFKNVEYISSAGLRVVLKTKKSINDTTVINCSNDVYDIFDMTGFSEIITIKKAFREISVDGCEIIGTGANGTVYRIAPDTIVKVFREGISYESINSERELARKAFVLGVPTAISYDIVMVGNKYGAVFELLDASTLATLIAKNPQNLDGYINMFVNVLKTIHASELKPGTLTNAKNHILKKAYSLDFALNSEDYTKLVKMCEELIDDPHMLHGDYHIKNIMVQGNEPFIIDMDTLSQGSPIIEFGFMYSCYCAYQEIDKNNGLNFFGVPGETLEKIFCESIKRTYPNMSEEEYEQFVYKCRILSYVQLIERFRTDSTHQKELELFKLEIHELLSKVDNLNI